MKLVLGITGASGSVYAKRIIEIIANNSELVEELSIVFTETGKSVWKYEVDDMKIENIPFKIWDNTDYYSPIASGSSSYDTMVICPCTMGTLGKIANGIADNLLTRAADVMLKEKRNLVIVPREAPLNIIHLENMKNLIQSGAVICPAMPSFYSKPQNINELIDTVIQKIFRQIQINLNFFNWDNKNHKSLH